MKIYCCVLCLKKERCNASWLIKIVIITENNNIVVILEAFLNMKKEVFV